MEIPIVKDKYGISTLIFTKKFTLNKSEAISKMNKLGSQKQPFIFVIDFEMKNPIVINLDQAAQNNVFYNVNGQSNFPFGEFPSQIIDLIKTPIPFNEYLQIFQKVQKYLHRGDSFLVNLTQPTSIEVNLTLQEIFEKTRAKYQLYFKDQFVCFSPEIFVKIKNNIISSHPMKGTISAEIENAVDLILIDQKELAEHTTIVDLIRNDISMIAEKVWVERFRYIDKIKTKSGDLYQVSSEICGQLNENWSNEIGTLLFKMLPAGSICGAPKPETLKIIKEVENYDRGYYTGIFGIFDGECLDSGVMIRFIEKHNQGLIFKSGGGITTKSLPTVEYQELIDKIYITA